MHPTQDPSAEPKTHARPRARGAVAVALVAWAIAAVAGSGLMLLYEKRPGRAAEAPAAWPSASRVPRAPARTTLVMILHPRCPCSSASVEQLDRMLTRVREPLQVVVLMVRPSGTPPGWERTRLWNRASAIRGVTVMSDSEGVEAARFGSWTSGQVLVYDPRGRLRFSGGITGSRGMAGDNAGAAAALFQIESATGATVAGASVYGCDLRTPEERRKGAVR